MKVFKSDNTGRAFTLLSVCFGYAVLDAVHQRSVRGN